MPAFGANQQKVSDIRARDQQYDTDAAHQHPEQFADVPDHVLTKGPDPGAKARRLKQVHAEARRRWKAAPDGWNQAQDVGIGLCQSDTGPQPRNSVIAELAQRRLVAIKLQRQHQGGLLAVEKAKIPRHHPNHLPQLAVHCDRPAHDRPIAAEASLPVAVIQHHSIGSARRVICAAKPAAKHRSHTQRRQHSVGNNQGRHLLGIALSGNRN